MSVALKVFDARAVREALTVTDAIAVVRKAMIALSSGQVEQALRSFIPLGEEQTFALMPAALGGGEPFGAKLISVFADADHPGRKRHQGLVVLFDAETGAPVCVADAEEITRIRTAAASAAATDALARPEAARFAMLGLGAQARAHIEAIAQVRNIQTIRVWGRDYAAAQAFAREMDAAHGLTVQACRTAADAVKEADIVCTVTGASDPVLQGDWLAPGTHVNLVGSSGPAKAEADTTLVVRSRFIADHAGHVRAHGGEYLRALEAGVIDDTHIAAEIGAVFAGDAPGRTGPDEITVYKSLGHAVQDLAAAAWLYANAKEKENGH
ncbi:ornithine cyclodeaminase [Marinicauda pacifica]|uniref:Ornithine cyclodeaminase family protein n=1 Tax=Marinicauda pacifica TaxID=1133559 RepID=A0A4S2HB97_9PROT|nr:ornithine cyclodeaminase family protein [Marinicauda pacifica]TGY92938.1 ornithine cyclodeaminase family protein [Marinicauda pacifica]GGE41525.1 ornithine cyclodeaminase [Marinicauda pacifica]